MALNVSSYLSTPKLEWKMSTNSIDVIVGIGIGNNKELVIDRLGRLILRSAGEKQFMVLSHNPTKKDVEFIVECLNRLKHFFND